MGDIRAACPGDRFTNSLVFADAWLADFAFRQPMNVWLLVEAGLAAIGIALMTAITSCTTTITRKKNPVIATRDSLKISLNALVSCQHFNLDGKEITTNTVLDRICV